MEKVRGEDRNRSDSIAPLKLYELSRGGGSGTSRLQPPGSLSSYNQGRVGKWLEGAGLARGSNSCLKSW